MTASFRLYANPRYAPARTPQDGDPEPVIVPERRAAARAAVTGFEGYRPTPLHRLDGLAETLGIEALWLKDESGRFGLGSFKALGGAYAVVHLLRERLGEAFSIADVAAGRAAARVAELTVCCATDGNHGLAVAWGARRAGARSTVFLPGPVSAGRERAIAAQGAAIVRIDGSYDEAVRACADEADDAGAGCWSPTLPTPAATRRRAGSCTATPCWRTRSARRSRARSRRISSSRPESAGWRPP